MSKTDFEGRPKSGVGSWVWRRAFLWAVNLFSAWVIAYVLWEKLDTRPADTAVMMAFGTMMMSVGSYVFGAAWDDRNKMELLGKKLGDDDRTSAIGDRPLR